MKRLAFLTIFTCLAAAANAKVIFLHIDQALQQANSINTITVVGYKDSVMLYKLPNSNDTFSISCWAKPYSEPFRETLIKAKVMLPADLAGKWPDAGQQVLMVTNSRNRVSLFATRMGNDYRFWDPNSIPFANSIFVIPDTCSYRPLPGCNGSSPFTTNGYLSCTDGCLVSAADVEAHRQAAITNSLFYEAAGWSNAASNGWLLNPLLLVWRN